MKQIYEWDKEKARLNFAKHGVSFEEAETVFDDPLLLTYPDEFHSEKEERFVSIGYSKRRRLLLVVHVEKLETGELTLIRIVSCRKATSSERRRYEESE